jgi:parallel beta-helix repeat protein
MKTSVLFSGFLLFAFSTFGQWTPQASNTSQDLNSIHFLNDSVGFVVGDNGVFLKTNDRGLTWELSVLNATDDLNAVCAINEEIIFAGGDNLYKSIDGGQNWNIILNQFNGYELKFFTPSVGFLKNKWLEECGVHGQGQNKMKYFQTADGGNTWQLCPELPIYYRYDSEEIDIISADTAFLFGNVDYFEAAECAVFSNSPIYKTTDGGLNWNALYDGTPDGTFINASFVNSSEGYVVKYIEAENTRSLYKVNGGGSEFVYVTNLTGFPIRCLVFATLSEGYYNIGGKIMRTSSGGIFWVQDYDGSLNISEMVITENYEGYAVGKTGLILHKKINPSNEPIKYLNCSETSVIFPKININEEGIQSFTLTSSGNADVTADIIAPSNFLIKPENAENFVSQISGLIIPAQHDTTINVAFSPQVPQFYSDTISIASNASNNPLINLSVKGKGIYILPEIISSDTSYCADSVWLRDNLTIDQGSSLTICPGTTVIVPFTLTNDPDIVISGSLYAIGTLQDSIRFVVDRKDLTWDGINIIGDDQSDSVFIHYCLIEDTHKDNNGGAIAVYGNQPVSILHSTLQDCRSNNYGGGIYCSGPTCRIEDCLIQRCVGGDGGGIYIEGSPDYAITNCIITQCNAWYGGIGGGILYQNGDGLIVQNCDISSCFAEKGGGLFLSGNNYQVRSTPVIDCGAYYGGGLYLSGTGPSVLDSCVIQNCSADYDAGGVFISGAANLNIRNSSILNCQAPKSGAGIFILSSPDNCIENCDISSNTTYGDGGGIYLKSTSPVIKNCTISYNRAFTSGSGAGIRGFESSPEIFNNFIFKNEADSVGGGIFLEEMEMDKTTRIIQNFISFNWSRLKEGGGIFLSGQKADLFLNTIDGNGSSWTEAGGIFCSQPDSSRIFGNISFHNKIVPIGTNDASKLNVSFCDIEGGWNGNGIGNTSDDPLLYEIHSYPWYYLGNDYFVRPGSTCIDAGIIDTTGLRIPVLDLAGNPRISGGRLDIGASENHFLFQTIDTGFCIGQEFRLEVVPDHEGEFTASWMFNGEFISGADSNVLIISDPVPENEGFYNCILYFNDFTLHSRRIYLYNQGYAPQVDVQPQGAVLNIGDDYSLEFYVEYIDHNIFYQWYKNDSAIVGANHWWFDIESFSIEDQGTYKCWTENSCGGVFSNEAVLTFSHSGIDEPGLGGLVVYPNPAGGQLTVSSQQSAVSGQRSAVGIEILDLFGRSLMQFKNIASFPYLIDISSLPDGMYILKMTTKDGYSSSKKFLKVSE